MLVAHMYITGSTGRGETIMKTFALTAERPPIDRSIPAKLETATFALG